MHGGQETTLLSMMFPFIHHGAIIVGIPYSEQGLIQTARGGTPYGASSVSGPMANQGPDEIELNLAKYLGRRVAEIAAKLRG
jgi:NAD(P)H dehydrogenase (quinone)